MVHCVEKNKLKFESKTLLYRHIRRFILLNIMFCNVLYFSYMIEQITDI